MTVREVALRHGRFHVTGVGYAPVGIFLAADELLAVDPRQEQDLHFALSIGAWCNNARVLPTRSGADWQVIGDPTEGALLVAAMKAGTVAIDRGRHVVFEVPFDSERKMMTVVVQGMDQRRMMYSKGAPEVILERCLTERSRGAALPLTDARRQEIKDLAVEMAARALRVLALAYRALPHGSTGSYEEAGLTFAALVGMLDPPREEAKQAVRICHQAGIRPVMITGDHPTTAQAIARELGIVGESDLVETGQQLDTLDEEELLRQVDRIAVYARVAAEHKMRVVEALKRRGHIVAMTGDGVNDAPAIKSADIGIAMGITGSDVTREAADMVLLDDNFASIVNAVEEGRAIYDNIQKVVLYLLSSNSSEVLLVFLAAVLGWPAPLLAVQLLWINLVSDGFPALALGVEPPERDVMRRRPQQPHQPVISWARGARMFAYGSLMAAVGLIGFATVYRQDAANLPEARTVAFCVLAFTQLFFAVSCRSERYTLPELGLLSNPHLIAALMVSALLQLSVVSLPFAQPIFEVATNLPPSRWGLILALALVPVTVVEVAKLALGWARSR
jgi:Ca2+-transporting ATPase